ncbi:MAG: lysophospholipid acyltransferase family protein [Pseudohongiellaceae bacterium]
MTNPCKLPVKPRLLATTLEAALSLRSLGKHYDARPPHTTAQEFLQYVLDALGVQVHVNNADRLADIPASGPLLIVANHPLGGLEGVAIARLIGQIRPDLKVLTNQLLRLIPELADLFIGVDVLSGNAAASNASGIRQVHKHLKNAGAVLIFPAGTVSVYNIRHRRIQDASWNRLVGGLVRRYGCTTLPIHVGGRNSSYFYAAGMIHPRLRTALLPRQLANKQGFTLELSPGRPVPATELRLLTSAQAVTEYLRVSTDALCPELTLPEAPPRNQPEQPIQTRPTTQAAKTIADLQDCRLIEHEETDVYCVPYKRLGIVMDDIAIAREISFRAVGDGTGRSKDVDEFDPHYLHLFLWDKTQQCVAGAYRVGLVDEIIAEHGIKGLYSRSLYKYNKTFIHQLGSAIEMGRSFIHPEYQRKPTSLNLLWRGIGKLLIQNPRYHTLFGSVGISRDYSDMARALIADTMLTNYRADGFDELVKPVTPLKVENRVWTQDMLTELANIKMLGKLIGRCDPGKAVPVLLRHYLSLNGRLVCFNVDPDFNDSLVGLIIVDVRKTDPKTLNRFMGAEGAEHFLNYQLRQSA